MEDEEPEGEEAEEKEGDEDDEKEEEDEDEEKEKETPCPLTEEVLKEGLSLLSTTGNGLAYAYVKFEAKDKGLTDISLLERFIHLRYVDLSKNKLKDLAPLSSLTQLLWLKVDRNLLTSASMQEMPYLQVISFDFNQIMNLEGITHPLLASLSLKENKIQTVLGLSHDQLFSLQVLELRGNEIETTAGLGVSKLKKLYLVSASLATAALSHIGKESPAQLQAGERGREMIITRDAPNLAAQGSEQSAKNTIYSLEGLEEFEQLETLHLRDNKLEALEGFSDSMKCLQYLNLRSNGIKSFQEVEKLQVLPMLQTLVLMDNPCAEEPNYRLEVLSRLLQLQRLDKESVEEEEREEAKNIRQTRKEKEKEMKESLEDTVAE